MSTTVCAAFESPESSYDINSVLETRLKAEQAHPILNKQILSLIITSV